MIIKAGDMVAVKHYTLLTPFISFVNEIKDDNISIMLTKDFPENNLLVGEPIVLGYEATDQVYVLGCDIEEIDVISNSVRLNFDYEDSYLNLRSRERFPVSLYADLISSNRGTRQLVIIKDLSLFGMRIYSKVDLYLDELVEISIYTEKDVVFLKGKIVRDIENSTFNEYGVGIQFENLKSMNLIENYLKNLKYAFEQQIKKLKFGI